MKSIFASALKTRPSVAAVSNISLMRLSRTIFQSIALLAGFYMASFGASTLGAAQTPADKCSNLKNTFSMANMTISSAEVMAPGSTVNLQNPTLNGLETLTPPVTGLPAFCRVIATLAPSRDSKIGIEVWMPISGWNGKFQAMANHESGGLYYYGDMSAGLKRNYAVASTDTGHVIGDTNWAVGHPEKIVDYSWRAVHEMTVTAKAMIAAFYGSAPRYSYYNGCSTGGRQTLKEAQMFPDDYDGILSGSGFHYWTHQIISNVWKQQVMLKDGVNGPSYLPPAKHQLVVAAAMDHCKSLKQVPTDAFLGNPRVADGILRRWCALPGRIPIPASPPLRRKRSRKFTNPYAIRARMPKFIRGRRGLAYRIGRKTRHAS